MRAYALAWAHREGGGGGVIVIDWHTDEPGAELLLMGNEAIARGALEANVRVAAAYPGNPSSEIIATLATLDASWGIHVEWSTNEKVALEVAAAGSLVGLRGLAAMKQNGLNVASDFLLNLNLTGCKAGMVVVVCDDPGGLSSTNEQDSRWFATMGDLPLLEPSGVDEARRMTRFAFTLSEELGLPVLVRSVTRISHARATVRVDRLPSERVVPRFGFERHWVSVPAVPAHAALREKLERAHALLHASGFNALRVPEDAELLVVASGPSRLFAAEALSSLGLEDRVGLLELGTTWPFPETLAAEPLREADRILVCEDVDPFVERSVCALLGQGPEPTSKCVHGRGSGDLPAVGELDPKSIRAALCNLLGLHPEGRPQSYVEQAKAAASLAPRRAWGFCAGCPHRASYWILKRALARDNREGFVVGDIGCYGLGFGPSGFGQMRTMQSMGSGTGIASGMGALRSIGLSQPAIAVCGDSTFFHAALPALVNARYNDVPLLVIVLDNDATAMTGFQPHPGTGRTAQRGRGHPVDIASVCRGIGIEVSVADPFEMDAATQLVNEQLERAVGQHVVVFRQPCALERARRRQGPSPRMTVQPDRCSSDACGCNRVCTRLFRCPGLVWSAELGAPQVDAALCSGCGVCGQLCPSGALVLEERPC